MTQARPDASMQAPALTAGLLRQPRRARVLSRASRNLPVLGLVLLLAAATLWPLIVPYDPLDTAAGHALTPPSGSHLFGTDQSGRDVLSRVIAGSRISCIVAFGSVGLAVLGGGLLGTVAAVAPRWVGETIMRVLDVFLAFPAILLAVVIAAALGQGTLTTVVVIAIVYTPALARFSRAVVLREMSEDYVVAARLVGNGRIRLLGYHVGANVAVPLLVYAATVAADAIVLEAALSFIGIGIAQPAPSWGNIIHDGSTLLTSGQWWIGAFGGCAVFLTVLVLNSVANWLNRRLDAGVEAT